MQELPVLLKFAPVDLRPGLDKALLCLRQFASKTLDGVNREYGGVFVLYA